MAVVFTVQADTQEDCVTRLARLCEAFGLAPALPPACSAGTGRWMARATEPQPAPVPADD